MICVLVSQTNFYEYAKTKGLDICDVGTYEYVPCDSPYFAVLVGREVASGRCKYGVLICATGTGMVIAANKVKGVMCGMGYDDEVTKLMREHNNANVRIRHKFPRSLPLKPAPFHAQSGPFR